MLAVDVKKQLGALKLAVRFEAAGGVTALFGPSGAGKTSVVNMIAGLVAPDRGSIAIDKVNAIRPAARQQQRALHPRRNAADNTHSAPPDNRAWTSKIVMVPRLTTPTSNAARQPLNARPWRAMNQFSHSA